MVKFAVPSCHEYPTPGSCRHDRASPLRHCPLDLPRPGSGTHPVDEQAPCPDVLRLAVHPDGEESIQIVINGHNNLD
jgi:hypothetical protein